MCGIVYIEDLHGNPVNNDIMQQFDKQRSRGTQGFGLFDGQEMNMVHASKEDSILKWLVKYDSSRILFHHRMPTSTINVKRAAHPFSTKAHFGKNQYILVHNGHISNAKELYEEHQKLGIKYQSVLQDGTFNDSEALLWDFALTLEGKQQVLKASGGIAFVCLKLVKGQPKKMYFARNSNPLNIMFTEDRISISSEGEGQAIEADTLFEYDYKKKTLESSGFIVPGYSYPSRTHSHDEHYMGWNWQEHRYNYQDTPKPGSAGDWLPIYLRKKYEKFIKDPIGDDPVVDYDRNGDPIFASDAEFESYDDYYEKRRQRNERPLLTSGLTDEEIEDMEVMTADESEVNSRAFEYMIQARGNFETAYWLAESDYDTLLDAEKTQATKAEVLIMEGVLETINNDIEYVNEKSVSSSWRAIEQQMELAV